MMIASPDVCHAAKTESFRVVDDHEPFRNFVCSTLQVRSELQVVGEASDGLEAVQKAKELQPDLICLDIGMPTLNGIEAAHRISKLVPAAKILFISQDSDPEVIAAALGNGAKG
jgi:DNA-binding NarL/FixJ family response regulator